MFDTNRYERQLKIIQESGQQALNDSSATIVGLGGLGSPVATYLAAAGVGKLVLIDHDKATRSNLNRQFLHWEKDLSSQKTNSAREKLSQLNSDIKIETSDVKLTPSSKKDLPESDLIIGSLDNFRTRYLVNEYAVEEGIPYIHGAVEGFEGQLTTIIPGQTPCLRCIFPQKPPDRKEIPVLGTTAGIIGAMMANEAIKHVTGSGSLASNELILVDLANNEFERVNIKRDPSCPVCGNNQL
ncbi:MAG: HesA/MoeB/ThiF family protein [Candidatus Bipolaricaulota bacterium]